MWYRTQLFFSSPPLWASVLRITIAVPPPPLPPAEGYPIFPSLNSLSSTVPRRRSKISETARDDAAAPRSSDRCDWAFFFSFLPCRQPSDVSALARVWNGTCAQMWFNQCKLHPSALRWVTLMQMTGRRWRDCPNGLPPSRHNSPLVCHIQSGAVFFFPSLHRALTPTCYPSISPSASQLCFQFHFDFPPPFPRLSVSFLFFFRSTGKIWSFNRFTLSEWPCCDFPGVFVWRYYEEKERR